MKIRRPNRVRKSQSNFISIIVLTVILMGVLLFFTNQKQQEQIFKSYCGDYGLYGKTLTLMKDGSLRLGYYGCSQSNGYYQGSWEITDTVLNINMTDIPSFLDSTYSLKDNKLISQNNEDIFILCEDFNMNNYKGY